MNGFCSHWILSFVDVFLWSKKGNHSNWTIFLPKIKWVGILIKFIGFKKMQQWICFDFAKRNLYGRNFSEALERKWHEHFSHCFVILHVNQFWLVKLQKTSITKTGYSLYKNVSKLTKMLVSSIFLNESFKFNKT